MEDFEIKNIQDDPDTPTNQQWRSEMENFDVKKEFNSKYEEARQRFGKRPNILVCGYTGSGKSSLVKAILGDVVPDSAIGDGAPKTMGYDCYENDLVRIWDSKGLELGETEASFTEETRRFVRSRQDDPNVDNHIHLVWYTIQGPGAMDNWYGEEEQKARKADVAYARRAFPPAALRQMDGMAHGELAMVCPERFYAEAMRFLSGEGEQKCSEN